MIPSLKPDCHHFLTGLISSQNKQSEPKSLFQALGVELQTKAGGLDHWPQVKGRPEKQWVGEATLSVTAAQLLGVVYQVPSHFKMILAFH